MPEAIDNASHTICCLPVRAFIHLNDKCTMIFGLANAIITMHFGAIIM